MLWYYFTCYRILIVWRQARTWNFWVDLILNSVFCEYNFLADFLFLSELEIRDISLEIIKSFSILILNLHSKATLFYIFSNNFINQLLCHNYEKYDEEIVAFYINFIKSLSLKIDETSIRFFYQDHSNKFSLIENALKYYNYPDPMIKTTVRNIFLTILKCKIPLNQ